MQDIKNTSTKDDLTPLADEPVLEKEQAESAIEEKEASVIETSVPEKEIIDIKMVSPKKTYRINGDNSKVIELNPTDINVIVRAREVYSKLNNLAQRAGSLLVDQEEATTEKGLAKVAKALADLDKEMRDLIDYLFDSKVSDVLASGINMYSPVNGEFWFEHCIEVLSNLYENNFNSELQKMKSKVNKQASKYIG